MSEATTARRVTTHHDGTTAGDASKYNDLATIEAGPVGLGGAPGYYDVAHPTATFKTRLPFQTVNTPGLTNEILLAVVHDRLERFQEGPYPCAENAAAMAKIQEALAALHKRTARRETSGLEGKHEEVSTKTAAGPRVYIEKGNLVVGDLSFTPQQLSGWAGWSGVESACQKLDGKVTAYELATIREAALTPAAKNGFEELTQALTKTSRVGS